MPTEERDWTAELKNKRNVQDIANWCRRELATARRTGTLETRPFVQNAALIIAALDHVANPLLAGGAELDAWIEQKFTGSGVAIREERATPIPGEPFMSMAEAKMLTREAVAAFTPASDADAMRETIARAVYRYQEGPGTFDEPGSIMGDLIKKISTDEAENIRRAIMGEPELPLESDSSDKVF